MVALDRVVIIIAVARDDILVYGDDIACKRLCDRDYNITVVL